MKVAAWGASSLSAGGKNGRASKGKEQLAQQLRYPARQHCFDLAYDEFTADNLLNPVFRYLVPLL